MNAQALDPALVTLVDVMSGVLRTCPAQGPQARRVTLMLAAFARGEDAETLPGARITPTDAAKAFADEQVAQSADMDKLTRIVDAATQPTFMQRVTGTRRRHIPQTDRTRISEMLIVSQEASMSALERCEMVAGIAQRGVEQRQSVLAALSDVDERERLGHRAAIVQARASLDVAYRDLHALLNSIMYERRALRERMTTLGSAIGWE